MFAGCLVVYIRRLLVFPGPRSRMELSNHAAKEDNSWVMHTNTSKWTMRYTSLIMNSVHPSHKILILISTQNTILISISTQLDFFSQENCSSGSCFSHRVFLSENLESIAYFVGQIKTSPHVPIHNIHEFTIKTRLFIPSIFKNMER